MSGAVLQVRLLHVGRLIAPLAVLLPLAWLTVATGYSSVVRSVAPDQALALAPWDARSSGLAAAKLIVDNPTGASLRTVRELAERAIARDPTFVPALVALGLERAQSNDEKGARTLMQRSALLSKRDLPTRLWLIEDRVSAGDVPGALYHYDIALRTSPSARTLLFPILIKASADPQLTDSIARLLAKKPVWAFYFFPQFISQAPSKAQLFDIVSRMAALGARPDDDAMKLLIQDFAASGEYVLAYRAYLLAGRTTANAGDRFQESFDRLGPYPPIDWQLQSESSSAPAREIRAGQGSSADYALFFSPGTDADGVVALRLVKLPSGRYNFGFDSGLVDRQARPSWSLACAGTAKTVLLHVDFDASPDGRKHQNATFVVPPKNCDVQTLSLSGGPGILDPVPRAWTDNISMSPSR